VRIPESGKFSYALRFVDATDPARRIVGSIIELEVSDSDTVHVSAGSPDEEVGDLGIWLMRRLEELEVDDPAVSLFVGVVDGDTGKVEAALARAQTSMSETPASSCGMCPS
jgi:hypothetical protein